MVQHKVYKKNCLFVLKCISYLITAVPNKQLNMLLSVVCEYLSDCKFS